MKNQTATLPISSAKKSTFHMWLNRKNTLLSTMVEEKITNKQMLLVVNASCAFTILVCSSFYSAISALLILTWFIHSIYLCKKGGLNGNA